MSRNPYSSQTIAGFNAGAPPDDGTKVAANQLEWAKHKTKLADPIKTLAEAINSQALAAFGFLVMTDDPGAETVVTAMEEFMPGYVLQAVNKSNTTLQITTFANALVAPDVHTIIMLQEFV